MKESVPLTATSFPPRRLAGLASSLRRMPLGAIQPAAFAAGTPAPQPFRPGTLVPRQQLYHLPDPDPTATMFNRIYLAAARRRVRGCTAIATNTTTYYTTRTEQHAGLFLQVTAVNSR